MNKIARHIIFVGRVQGVGFRFTAYNIARRRQLTGMVRNLPDGNVEMLAQGKPQDISDCLEDIKDSFQYGLKETKINEVPYNSEYTNFIITP